MAPKRPGQPRKKRTPRAAGGKAARRTAKSRGRKAPTAAEKLERAAAQKGKSYLLRLYVSGFTPQSRRAVENLRAICDQYMEGHVDLEVVDIFQTPGIAQQEQIVAAPTLVKKLPLPIRRLIGDLSNTEHVLYGLDLIERR